MQLQRLIPLGFLGLTCGLVIPKDDHIDMLSQTLSVSSPLQTGGDTASSPILILDPTLPVTSAPPGSRSNTFLQVKGTDTDVAGLGPEKRASGNQRHGRSSVSASDNISSSTSSKSHRPTVVVPPPGGVSNKPVSDEKENVEPDDASGGSSPADAPVSPPVDSPVIDESPADLPNVQPEPDADENEQRKEQERQRKEERQKKKEEHRQRVQEAAEKMVAEHQQKKEEAKQRKVEQKAKEKEEALKKEWERRVTLAEEMYRNDEISRGMYKKLLRDSRRITGFPVEQPPLTSEQALVQAHAKAVAAHEKVVESAKKLADAENARVNTEQNKKLRMKKKEQLKKVQHQREIDSEWCEAEPSPEIRSALKKGNTPWEPCQSGKFTRFDPKAKSEDAKTKYNPQRINKKQTGGK
nr:reticulocyte-binding protein 2 like a [Quercus suber]